MWLLSSWSSSASWIWRTAASPALCRALLVWALVQALWLGGATLAAAALGMLVGGALFLLVALAGRGAMGAGDVKLAAALAAVLAYPLILVTPRLIPGPYSST